MLPSSFAIIGCGATTLAFLDQHLDDVEMGAVAPSTIYVFEKRAAFGPGAAYEFDLASNLLNTKTAYITPFPSRPGHFKQWIDANRDRWTRQFPGFTGEPESYAPRPLFGMYLAEQMNLLVLRAAGLNVQIVTLRAEVTDVEPKDGYQVLWTRCGVTLGAAKVFLFCGTMPPKFAAENTHARIAPLPYPTSNIVSQVGPDDRIAIVGARLSAIDAAIALIEGGHRGIVRMHSRSGFFPAVRGTQGRITPSHFSIERIRALSVERGALEIRDVVHLFEEEMQQHDPTFDAKIMPLPTPPEDIRRFLREELSASEGARHWQAILYATNGFIEELWQSLSPAAQQKFLSEYMSLFMAFQVSIPPENARKILTYLETGVLEFIPGKTEPARMEGDEVVLRMQDRDYHYDRVINATGSPRDVRDLDSDLLQSLLRRGAVSPHPLGGVRVDPETYLAIGSVPQMQAQLYVAGELTVGENFFTSALEICARHASRCAKNLVPASKPEMARA